MLDIEGDGMVKDHPWGESSTSVDSNNFSRGELPFLMLYDIYLAAYLLWE